MNGQLFEQSFVYCNICHRRHSNGDPLRLTSCAHILCSMHVNNDNVCPVCSTHDISVIKLEADKNLPNDVTSFFEPLPNLLETIYNVSQFQQQALVNQIQYYQTHCVKLREKVARQQQLLYKAKQELDGVTQLKNQVANLEMKLRQANANRNNSDNYRSQSQTISKFFDTKGSNKLSVTNFDTKSNTSLQPPMTVDLTMDDSSHEDGGNFLSKLKRTASLRNGIITATNTTNTRQIPQEANNYRVNTYGGNSNNNVARNGSIAVNDGIEAESTQLAKYAYSPNNGRSVTKDLTSMRVSSLSSLSSGSSSRGHSSLTYGSSHSIQTKDRNSNNSGSNRNKFPQALDRLRIAKRNSTTNNEPIRTISNSQGIIAHMRSSSNNNNNNRHTNSTFSSNRRSLTSQVTGGSKYTNSQTSTTKTRRK